MSAVHITKSLVYDPFLTITNCSISGFIERWRRKQRPESPATGQTIEGEKINIYLGSDCDYIYTLLLLLIISLVNKCTFQALLQTDIVLYVK